MNGLAYLLVVAVGCWLLRLTFIVFVPPDRLPPRLSGSLTHAVPAVLAALVSAGVVQTMRADRPGVQVVALGCLTGIAAVAAARRSLALSAGLGLATALLIDLLLVR
jgi:branched-subunit amino acid transport protein